MMAPGFAGGVREGRVILEGKTIIVSGVGPGLGREIARLALRDGANVMLGARNQEKLEKMAADLDPSGARVHFVSTDITQADQCERLVASAVERYGAVDGMAQVAALDTQFGGVTDTAPEDYLAAISTNLLGPAQLVRCITPRLEERGGGAVVFIGSQSMYLPQVMQIAYAASKGALMSAMYYMAKELGPKRIRVNTVVPTWMWGPPVEGYVNMMSQQNHVPVEQVVGGITANMPLGEIPADEDVAETVTFLLSNRARMITGQSIFVNAGELMR
jgi:NAD(P)-dependent dehydrogenase (short-subunit alcohol dehydrogenase family)